MIAGLAAKWRGRAAWTVAAVIVLSGAVFSTARVKAYTMRPYLHDNLYLPSGSLIRQASLGYREMAADIVWFQAVQYYGGYRKAYHDLAYFHGLIDIVTDLDPYFVFPYRFGAAVLASDMGSLDDGITLLKKGMVHNPTRWEFPFEIGFLSYIGSADHEMAARYFELAARLPGGGDRARRFAAFVYSRSGHTENSIRMWEELKETSDVPWMRELAEREIQKLHAPEQERMKRDDA